MNTRTLLSGLAGGSAAVALALANRYVRRESGIRGRFAPIDGLSRDGSAVRLGAGAMAGAAAGIIADSLARIPRRVATLERLMPRPPAWSSYHRVLKPVPPALFADRGTGVDFETRPSVFGDYLTPNDRFYLRSHSPTPTIEVQSWRLTIDGSGVRTPLELSYDEISAMPLTTVTRTIECAGNWRRFFKEAFAVEAEGGQWGMGAIGCAEWTGVRLRDLLERTGVKRRARDVMPEGLDDHRVSRPMPLEKAMRDDTLLALRMNGEALSPDHGFPARVLVSGWAGVASIKWVGRIQVAEEPLYSPYNTMEYVLIGPDYPMRYPALGPPVAEMPVVSILDLDWPAILRPNVRTIRGRSFAGEGKVRGVVYSIDGGSWRPARLIPPNIEAAWVRWEFDWEPTRGNHFIRVRATDERGRTQPESVPWNHHGYLYNAVVAHPVAVM